MITKNDVLNKISNFNCTIDAEKIKFPGILQEVNGNIVLNAMVSVDQYQKMLSSADFNILGSIFGKEATLIWMSYSLYIRLHGIERCFSSHNPK